MIHLDSNALIALPGWVRDRHPVVERIAAGTPAAVCAVVWYEFTIGPVHEQEVELARALLSGRILPISRADAELAAALFNRTGRKRRMKIDTLIAACAINASAELATLNVADFSPFVSAGLRLSN